MRIILFALSAVMLATGAFAAQSAHSIAFSNDALPQVQKTYAPSHTNAAYGSLPFSLSGRDEAIVAAMR